MLFGGDESNSNYAQGGISAVTLPGDTWQAHKEDTLVAGAGLCDGDAVEVMVKEGPQDIQKLLNDFRAPFDRNEEGGLLVSNEGAHKTNRILHCGGDATGFHITKTLIDVARMRKNITFMDNTTLIDILTDDEGRARGIIAQNSDGINIAFRSNSIVVASGGIGRIYRNSTNASTATGDGIAAAKRAGAELSNMEFVQFHPTALIHPNLNMRYFLISEALRGEGAILRNRKSEPFLEGVHPMKDLAPRDIVSRAIVKEMMKYDVPNVYLDITAKPREFLKHRFPVIYNECMRRGIDIAVNWIPVMPVQHYFMGGIKTNSSAETTIEGLYACGESACTGVHGANRLASNSLLECLVFGRHAAEVINGKDCHSTKKNCSVPETEKPFEQFDFETCRTHIRNTMTKKGGILRNEKDMLSAIEEIGEYEKRLKSINLINRLEYETLNMASVGLEILKAAEKRKESIGAHYRTDNER